MRGRLTVAALTVVAISLPGFAEAASVTPNPKKISGARVAVTSCGSLSGMSISWTSTAGSVTSVVVGSIPVACNGGALSLTLTGAGNASLGSAGPTVISSTSLTFGSVTGSPTASSVTAASVSVAGP